MIRFNPFIRAFIAIVFCFLTTSVLGQVPEFEKRKLEVEEQRIQLDKEKLEFDKNNEKDKATIEIIKSVITALALVIPLLIAVYSVRSQIKATRELKALETKHSLLLKATEIVMDARNAYVTKGKAEVVKEILKGQLPDDFVASFDPKKFVKPGPGFDVKLELFKLFVSNPDKEKQITELWLRMFPGDKIETIFPKDFESR
jgi:hypothetical protein